MQGNMQSILKTSSRFARSTSGNVAMMFSFAFVGIMAGIGLAVDLSHQSGAQASLQSAVDGVALSLARDAGNLTALQLTAKAQEQFDAAVSGTELKGLRVVANYQLSPTKALNVTVEGNLPSSFGAIFGINTLGLAARTIVPMSSRPVQLALVMDNTGSMSSHGKMTELKKAAKNLIDAMQKASTDTGNEIRISLVPFEKEVMIGNSSASASWIDWSGYKGKKSNWSGCVSDRDQPYDAKSTVPTNDDRTWYPASSCNLAAIMPLTTAWTNLKNRVDEMKPSGNTNLTIGLAWGLNMLTHGAPLSTASSDPGKYANYMILLTDGVNTENRWTTNSVSIDARALEACAQIKAAGIQLFTVRVIDGNANLLRTCASSPEMFYDVDDAKELTSVFDKISSSVKSAIYLSK